MSNNRLFRKRVDCGFGIGYCGMEPNVLVSLMSTDNSYDVEDCKAVTPKYIVSKTKQAVIYSSVYSKVPNDSSFSFTIETAFQ